MRDRKWFVERYPGIDSAVGKPSTRMLRCVRSRCPRSMARTGVRYLKASRFSDKIFRWAVRRRRHTSNVLL